MNRSANGLYIQTTNLCGFIFSLANHRQFAKFTKLSCHKVLSNIIHRDLIGESNDKIQARNVMHMTTYSLLTQCSLFDYVHTGRLP